MSDPVIGIDLGTTNSVVAVVEAGQPRVLAGRGGQTLTPSVVAIGKNGKRVVGNLAKRQAITNPRQTVSSVKRMIGRKFSSPEVTEMAKSVPYEVVCGAHDDVRVMLEGRAVSLPELSAMVLEEVKGHAEKQLGGPVRQAVITVPAYFNDGQRQATRDAGQIAGLEVLRIVNEPTAAAIAYGFGRNVRGKVAVFDLGGGTFDVTVLEIGEDVYDVLATGGDTLLGGEDFDQRIIDWLVVGFAKENGIDLRKDRMALQRLRDAAEKAKIELSSVTQTEISLPFICTPPGGGGALHLQVQLTRAKLDELTAELCAKTLRTCETVLRDANVRPRDLKEVILVGGMTRMPKIIEGVRKLFGRDPCKGVHPDEVVAMGAAIHAHSLSSEEAQVLLLDVTPQDLGVAIAGGFARTLIPKNTTVPTSVTEVFNTSKDFQDTVKIMVLQGEHKAAEKNELLGEFMLTGLREAPRGVVEIEVTFDIDAEGIVSVSGRDRETGRQQSIQVTASSGLTEDELRDILVAQEELLMDVADAALPPDDAASQRRARLGEAVTELRALFPEVERLTDGSDFGRDVLARSEKTIAEANAVVNTSDVSAMDKALEQTQKTVNLLRGLLHRMGGA